MAHILAAGARSALLDLGVALAQCSTSGTDTLSERARLRLLDTLGATSIGFATPEGRILHDYAERCVASGQHASMSARCRALVGATRSTEIDDIDVASCATVGAVIVPVALTYAAVLPAIDSRALLASLVTGYEAMIRLGRAIEGATALYRGIWPTYVTAAFGAAATAAKLLDLDAKQTAGALALALTRTMTLPPPALAPSGLRYYALGCAAVEGGDAALAASAGVAADPGAIESFASRIGANLVEAELTLDLGETWRICEVDTKMFPTSRQALTSIEAFMRQIPPGCLAEHIDAIVVRVPAAYLQMVDRPQPPARRIESMIGVQYAIALAALRPDELYDAIRASLRDDAPLRALMSKITVMADDELSARFPLTWGSTVTVQWRSVPATSKQVLEPSGSSKAVLDIATIRRKLETISNASGLDRSQLIARLAARCERLGFERDENAARGLLAELDGRSPGQDRHSRNPKQERGSL